MLRFFASAFLLFSIAHSVKAETVAVRSAEHSEFTRIVLDMKKPADVLVSKVTNGLQISLPKDVEIIQSSDFFRRISRELISDIEVDVAAGTIELQLTCDCSFSAFVSGENMFVVDLREAAQVEERRVEPIAWGLARRARDHSLGFGGLASNHRTKDKANPVISASTTVKPASQLPLAIISERALSQNSSRTRLLSNLDDKKQKIAELDTAKVRGEADAQIIYRSPQVVQSRAMPEIELRAMEATSRCTEPTPLNPSSWPTYEKAIEHLGSQRLSASYASDDFGDASLRKLAMTYLSLAMGAESGALLRAIAMPKPSDIALIELSKVVDGESEVTDLDGFAANFRCPELIVWQVLADEDMHLSEAQLKRIRADFDQWPSALQGVFSAKLASSLIKLDALESAEFSLRRSAKSPELRAGERAIVAASLAEKNHDTRAAIDLLEPVVSADADMAAEATIALSEIVLSHGQNMNPSHSAALESYSEELRGTEIEEDLIRTRLRVAIQQRDFEAAEDLIATYSKLARASQVNVALDEIGEAISELESDARFLKEAVSFPERYFQRFAEPVQQEIRVRMNSLGFSDLAEQLGSYRRTGATTVASEKAGGLAEGTSLPENRQTEGVSASSQQGAESGANVASQDGDRAPVGPANASTAQSSQRLADLPREGPIDKAVKNTQTILESVSALKEELAQLGF
ncbi:MAG: hypothetical protein WBC85_04680 [Planktotalea sp.]|uniref:hypothetical protein n=1 Tax=Planktotalea sp. TaxID=2029877 RepID=UPI003C7732DA